MIHRIPMFKKAAELPSSDEEGWRSERRGGAERSVRRTTHAPNPQPASEDRRLCGSRLFRG